MIPIAQPRSAPTTTRTPAHHMALLPSPVARLVIAREILNGSLFAVLNSHPVGNARENPEQEDDRH